MALSPQQHEHVQKLVDASSSEGAAELRANAENALHDINFVMGRRLLSAEERKESEIAIEILARLDARERGGGWWFRAKRRVQLAQMYFGS